MSVKDDVKFFVEKQKSMKSNLSVDVVLKNGNIVLRAFQIIQYNEKSDTLKGLTQQEAYSFLRENRAPVYCQLKLSEIKELECKEFQMSISSNR